LNLDSPSDVLASDSDGIGWNGNGVADGGAVVEWRPTVVAAACFALTNAGTFFCSDTSSVCIIVVGDLLEGAPVTGVGVDGDGRSGRGAIETTTVREGFDRGRAIDRIRYPLLIFFSSSFLFASASMHVAYDCFFFPGIRKKKRGEEKGSFC
jgi:hypothetical protein